MAPSVMWLLAVVVACEAFAPSIVRTPPLRQRTLGLPARDGGAHRRRRHRALMLAEPAAAFDATAAFDAAAATTSLAVAWDGLGQAGASLLPAWHAAGAAPLTGGVDGGVLALQVTTRSRFNQMYRAGLSEGHEKRRCVVAHEQHQRRQLEECLLSE